MSQSLPDAAPPPFTVSQLGQAIKRQLEQGFSTIRVRGEIGPKVTFHANGGTYFDLKDDGAVINAVAWRGTKLAIKPEAGIEVIVSGQISSFPMRSTYQLIVKSIEVAGIGGLLQMLEQRKQKLMAEGLFDANRKQPIPFLPRSIGVITSPTGAVIRDILHRLHDRFPRPVLVWPTLVQGDMAVAQIIQAIEGFNAIAPSDSITKPDVIIIARGGGSFEDLMCFNDEALVRAVAASRIPIISAVGHETDTTFIDYAADVRAPTPTAAAEMAVPVRRDLLLQLYTLHNRLGQISSRQYENRRLMLENCAGRMPPLAHVLGLLAQRLDENASRLAGALRHGIALHQQKYKALAARAVYPPHILTRAQDRLKRAGDLLNSLSYHHILARGFALITGCDNLPITHVGQLKSDDKVVLRLQDGERTAKIT